MTVTEPDTKPEMKEAPLQNPDEAIPRRIEAPTSSKTKKAKTRKLIKEKKPAPPSGNVEKVPNIEEKKEDERPEVQEPLTRKQSVILITNWVISGMCLIGGLFALLTYPLSGILLLLMGLILVPWLGDFLLKRWKIEVSWIWKGAAIAVLAGLFVVVQLRRGQANSISKELASYPIVGKDTLKTGFQKDAPEAESIENIVIDTLGRRTIQKYTAIGEKAVVGYFEISIDHARVDTSLGTDNVYAEQLPGDGNTFVILDVTFKCIDNESRIPRIGNLIMNVEGQRYVFDKTETVTAPGWGLYFVDINPLTTKSTKIVYKIPRDVKGAVFWEPGANPDSVRYYCGTI